MNTIITSNNIKIYLKILSWKIFVDETIRSEQLICIPGVAHRLKHWITLFDNLTYEPSPDCNQPCWRSVVQFIVVEIIFLGYIWTINILLIVNLVEFVKIVIFLAFGIIFMAKIKHKRKLDLWICDENVTFTVLVDVWQHCQLNSRNRSQIGQIIHCTHEFFMVLNDYSL